MIDIDTKMTQCRLNGSLFSMETSISISSVRRLEDQCAVRQRQHCHAASPYLTDEIRLMDNTSTFMILIVLSLLRKYSRPRMQTRLQEFIHQHLAPLGVAIPRFSVPRLRELSVLNKPTLLST
jgi:hypothetical protein